MIDRGVARRPVAEVVAAAVSGGVDWIQIRERGLEGGALLEVADSIASAAQRAAAERRQPVRVIVNRRADVALAIGADGVHLGFDGMEVGDARRLLGAESLVGVSAHGADELKARCAGSAPSYALLAPIFAPRSKTATRAPLGAEELAAAAAGAVPVLAQGGVAATNAGALVSAGAAGVAVTGAILMAEDPGAATRALRAALDA